MGNGLKSAGNAAVEEFDPVARRVAQQHAMLARRQAALQSVCNLTLVQLRRDLREVFDSDAHRANAVAIGPAFGQPEPQAEILGAINDLLERLLSLKAKQPDVKRIELTLNS